MNRVDFRPLPGARAYQARVLRRLVGLLFYLVAGFGALLSVSTAIMVRDLSQRHAGMGDTTAADMALWFLLDELAPLTLLALIAAIWLAPPASWFAGSHRHGTNATAVTPGPGMDRRFPAALLALAAVGILAFVARQLTEAIVTGYRHYDPSAFALMALVIRDLLVMSPLLALAIALFLSARKLVRLPRKMQ